MNDTTREGAVYCYMNDDDRAAWWWHFQLGGPHTKWTFEAMGRWGF